MNNNIMFGSNEEKEQKVYRRLKKFSELKEEQEQRKRVEIRNKVNGISTNNLPPINKWKYITVSPKSKTYGSDKLSSSSCSTTHDLEEETERQLLKENIIFNHQSKSAKIQKSELAVQIRELLETIHGKCSKDEEDITPENDQYLSKFKQMNSATRVESRMTQTDEPTINDIELDQKFWKPETSETSSNRSDSPKPWSIFPRTQKPKSGVSRVPYDFTPLNPIDLPPAKLSLWYKENFNRPICTNLKSLSEDPKGADNTESGDDFDVPEKFKYF